jgi:arylsulfatase A-like enzyme
MEARGSPGKLTGSKMYASEGGIRVPASIWWKGVIENSKTDQFFFVQDLLPTLLTATGIGIDKNIEFDGNNKWDNLLNGNLELPVNDLVANRVINDERALFNNEWKLYYSNPVMISGGAKYSLFNVMNDPYEQNDLSSSNVEIFEQMKITMMSMEENNVQPNINPVKQYLYGDTEGGEIVGSPWLEGDYKTEGTPSGFVSFFVMSWIIFLAFKLQIIGFIFILILSRILYKKFIKS